MARLAATDQNARRCQRFADSLRKGAGFRIEKALAHATRKAIHDVLARDHPQIFVRNETSGLGPSWFHADLAQELLRVNLLVL